MIECYGKISAALLTASPSAEETASAAATAAEAAGEAVTAAANGGGKTLTTLLMIIGLIVLITAIFIAVRIIHVIIWKNRNALRKRLIAMEKDDEIKTVALNVLKNKGDRIDAAASQILGTRSEQQDSYYISSDSVKFDLLSSSYLAATVCDGMGGLSSGEIASRLAVKCIEDSFRKFVKSKNKENITDMLRETALNANETVYRYSVEKCNGQMCGTTMVLVLLENNNLYWASVGDSRIYIIRDRQIVQITNDHNYAYTLNQKVSQGLMSEQEALSEADREALISYIGMSALDLIDLSVNPFKLMKGDIVLLCSDGLTKIMSDAQICDFVNSHKADIGELAQLLPLAASDMHVGSQDNTTVVVVSYK